MTAMVIQGFFRRRPAAYSEPSGPAPRNAESRRTFTNGEAITRLGGTQLLDQNDVLAVRSTVALPGTGNHRTA
jgi:hypothetical protein